MSSPSRSRLNTRTWERRFLCLRFETQTLFRQYWVNVAAIGALLVSWEQVVWRMVQDDQLPSDLFSPSHSANFLWLGALAVAMLFLWPVLALTLQKTRGPLFLLTPLLLLVGMMYGVATHPQQLSKPYLGLAIFLLMVGLYAYYWRVFHAVSVNHFQKLRGFWLQFAAALFLMAVLHSAHFAWGLIGAFFIPRYRRTYLMTASSRAVHVRGTELNSSERVEHEYDKMRRHGDEGFLFGGVRLPLKAAVQHLMFAGATGSGKTLSLRLFMQCVLPSITPHSGKRAIIHDYTRTMLPLLHGMGVRANIQNLNLFDARAAAWAIAQDIRTLADAAELAAILAPEPGANEKSDKFFREASQALLEGMTVFLQRHAPGKWTLRDLVIGLSSIELATALLMSDPVTQHYIGVLGSENTSANILSSVLVEIRSYRIIAALSDLAPTTFSLRQWLEGGHILLLGSSTQAEKTLSALNRLIFTRAVQMLIEHSEARSIPEPESFFILDELPQLGRLHRLVNLAEVVRARGGSIALCFQSYSRVCEIYGRESAAAILGMCRNKAVLRFDEPETSKWASDLLGEAQILRKNATYQHPEGAEKLDAWRKYGLSETVTIEQAVLPSEFRKIPPVDDGEGLTGYYLAAQRTWKHCYPDADLQELLIPENPAVPGFLPVPDHYQELRPWDETDWQRLNITTLMLRMGSDQLLEEVSEPFRQVVEVVDQRNGDSSHLAGKPHAAARPSSKPAPPPAARSGGSRTIDVEPFPEKRRPTLRLRRLYRSKDSTPKKTSELDRRRDTER